jgi:L-histidine N-alpha-methyltransferase
VPAYADAAGVTAAFNLNVLEVLNRRLVADFDPAKFEHRALWDAENAWIEMRLRALEAVSVRIAMLDLQVDFAKGEELRTEISAKFTQERLVTEFDAAGFVPAGWWTDPERLFSLSLWTPN